MGVAQIHDRLVALIDIGGPVIVLIGLISVATLAVVPERVTVAVGVGSHSSSSVVV